MSQAVYTYTNVFVAPYQFETITDLKLTKQTNEHAKLTISGIVPESKLDQYVVRANEQEHIELFVQDEDNKIVLFQGIVTSIAVQAVRNVRSITIEARSSSYLMDIKRESRTFQNKQLAYTELFSTIGQSYPQYDVIDEASQGKSIGGLLVQYKETDWQFAKRLASHFNAPLVPNTTLRGVKYVVGVPESSEPQRLEEFNYTIKKDLNEYRLKSSSDMQDIYEQNMISYEVTSNKIVQLCSPVIFQQRTLYVYRVETSIANGVLINKYTLRDKKGLSSQKLYNNGLSGISLFGKILDVSKDRVKVQLHIDGQQSKSKAIWFPYSTVFSSPDGTGWYCMPETGDEIRVYFPDEREENAFAASSVDTDAPDPERRSDPSVKSISTKYGKQIVFKPGAIEIIGSGKLLMRLTDEGGIEINSDKKIVLSAVEDIEINGGAKVLIQGEEGVDLKQANASLNILEQVQLSGAKVNIE
ncbi:contractile injection system protein, VgrG/Pvc8 family [Paenibacillus sp. 481]|uniref:contractile injection system protein, VgrG/Pvc8 family n=1 Tax=Paenibacillus sp. 481 TaxID=2835869 RepID=UPI001E3A6642|nr:contractile injection system protein, VgrG/Pvc8 family [Paenibacillus sp. 481]UHA74780.1 phage tail protein [Paenibacillus sp. 481]